MSQERAPSAAGQQKLRNRLSAGAQITALAVVYLAAARLGLMLDPVAGFATLVWAPTGIALAALLLLGYRVWPGVFVGALIANFLTGAPILVAAGIGVGNTLEAVVGVYALRRVPGFRLTLDRIRDVLAFIVLAAIMASAVSASVGVLSLSTGGIIAGALVAETWIAWWLGDAIGALLVAPLILVWQNARPTLHVTPRSIEAAALGVTTVAVGLLTFFGRTPADSESLVRSYVLFPVLIWASLRFEQRGAATATALTALVAIWGTTAGRGPFAQTVLHESLLSLQLFVGVIGATFLLLAATIAERRAAEDAARRAESSAREANRAKAEFLAVMSHELRTPLNAILGYVELLELGNYGSLNQEQLDALRRIQRNQAHLLSLVNDVLNLARVEVEHPPLRIGTALLADAFEAVESGFAPELARKQLGFERHLADESLAVAADGEKLRQIILNLLSNATKYTESGGSIRLAAERDGGRIRITITDTGIGIPEEAIAQVFEPFYQVDRGTTRRYPGVGLGLTIARDLARSMGGDVSIRSKLGEGTTVSVVLPAAG